MYIGYRLLLIVAGFYRHAHAAGCCLLLQVSIYVHMLQVVAYCCRYL